jgi:DNA-binding GntR family transcriptional regulator
MKLSEEQIKIIRAEYVPRAVAHKSPNVMELAKRFNISQETVRKVALRKVYRWVE